MGLLSPCSVRRGGFLYTMIVPGGRVFGRGGFLYTMIVPGGRVFVPFKSCPRGLSGWEGGGVVLDEIDTCISRKDCKHLFVNMFF